MSEEYEGREIAFMAMEKAQANISGHKVGAAVAARNKEGHEAVFGGCNIEFATSFVIHAERVALVKAISQGYTEILQVHVTSSSVEQQAALCGYCRQDFMYVNPDVMIYVYNPDKSLKIKVKLIDTMNYPYLSKGKIT